MPLPSRPGGEINREERIHKMLSVVFSHKPDVSRKRLAILKAIDKSSRGKMKFQEILDNVRSMEENGTDYSSQKLTYDLQVLRESVLISRNSEGDYMVTSFGSFLLQVSASFESEFSEIHADKKPSFVGGASGTIMAANFDYEKLGHELTKLPFFGRKFTFEKDKFCLKWADDDDNFKSEIEICRDGSFSVEVLMGVNLPDIKGSFVDDLEGDETKKWYRTARGLVQTIVYYIERTARKQWHDSKVLVPLEADSYPLNIYSRDS